MRPRSASLASLAALLASAAVAAPVAAAAPPPADAPAALLAALAALPKHAEIAGGLPLAFAPRPRADGSRRLARALAEAPVSIRFAAPPTAADIAALRAAGATVLRRPDGTPIARGRLVLARLSADAVPRVAALPGVVKVALDGTPFSPPPPLDLTAHEIQATDVHLSGGAAPNALTGAGITICDIDTGVDPFHPLLFRADGGMLDWIDVDGDGAFTPGVDGVDRDGDGEPEVLRVLDGIVSNYWMDDPMFGSDDPAFAPGMDWLYADLDGSGARDFGPEAGFTEADPTYGEPLYVFDDVNGNGAIDSGEKLVALGTSKLKALKRAGKVYRRGENLIDFPRDEGIAHGTGAAGVMVGGNPGLTRLVGIAPGAELVSGVLDQTGQELALAHFCLDEGARVVLHEYAPWVGYHLDGSSPLEELIDETAQEGVAHINPAGNLSTSEKLYKRTFAAGESPTIPVEAPVDSPYGEFRVLAMSWLWRDTARDLSVTLKDPTGFEMQITGGSEPIYTDWHDGLTIYAGREDSSRGTARLDVYVYGESADPPPIPLGTWELHVTDPVAPGGADLELIGYVLDELSGWGHGIYFPEDASEDHLIGYPGTADLGLAVSATTGHGFNGGEPGTRAGYSGRGHRIDGEPILWISAPDDPITSGYWEGREASYIIYGGTSGASPHVAGAAALLLEADPARTGVDVREAIRAGALVDEAVGETPNDDYGHGKLRIYQSLHGEDPPGGGPPSITAVPATVNVEEQTAIPIGAADPDEPADGLLIEVDRDYDGVYDEEVHDRTMRLRFGTPGLYTVRLRARDSSGREAGTLTTIEVLPLPLIAGGGCALGSRGREALWPIGAAALLALRRRRRRSRRG